MEFSVEILVKPLFNFVSHCVLVGADNDLNLFSSQLNLVITVVLNLTILNDYLCYLYH